MSSLIIEYRKSLRLQYIKSVLKSWSIIVITLFISSVAIYTRDMELSIVLVLLLFIEIIQIIKVRKEYILAFAITQYITC